MPDPQKDLYKKLLGRSGEQAAVKFLKKKKYKILERNYETPFGEVDIIAQDGETTVFCEVKTRLGEGFGTASSAVDEERRRRYILAAKKYIKREEMRGREITVRFDVVEVYPKGIPEDVLTVEEKTARLSEKKPRKMPELRHIPAAFR